jgi:hypothetical protein
MRLKKLTFFKIRFSYLDASIELEKVSKKFGYYCFGGEYKRFQEEVTFRLGPYSPITLSYQLG